MPTIGWAQGTSEFFPESGDLPVSSRSTSNQSESANESASSHATGTQPASGCVSGDRRDFARLPCGGPIWWKGPQTDTFSQGWLIERSHDGVAFLTRGQVDVVVGQRVHVSTNDPTDVGFRTQQGLVSRTSHVHGDLFLVAAQLHVS